MPLTHRKHYSAHDIAQQIKQLIAATWLQKHTWRKQEKSGKYTLPNKKTCKNRNNLGQTMWWYKGTARRQSKKTHNRGNKTAETPIKLYLHANLKQQSIRNNSNNAQKKRAPTGHVNCCRNGHAQKRTYKCPNKRKRKTTAKRTYKTKHKNQENMYRMSRTSRKSTERKKTPLYAEKM